MMNIIISLLFFWGSIGSGDGQKQSPIDIDKKTVISDHSSGTIHFKNYENPKMAKMIKNTGRHAEIDFEPKATISSDGLLGEYYLHQAHFHWGSEKSNGAEHTVNGKRYPMEMHLVHTKNNMSIEEASKQRDGFVILSFFITASQKSDKVTAWHTLAKFLKKIPEKGNSQKLNGELSLESLLRKADVKRYYRYQGSLTSPPFAEAVIWIIFEKPLEISPQVIELFTTSLYFTTIKENRRMQDNFRRVQALNGRKVYYHREDKAVYNCMKRCFANPF